MHKNMQTEMQIDAIAMLRTDGRTNGRATHLSKTSSVPERAGEIREFDIDPETGATPEWLMFIASLGPAELERERFGVPGPGERPGSTDDRRMRAEHAVRVQVRQQRRRRPVVTDAQFAAMCREVRAWDHRHENALTEDHVRIAIAAAESKGHAA